MKPSGVMDVAAGLRALADAIEADGPVYNVAYVIDNGGGDISIGLLGQSVHAAYTTYFLLAAGQAKMIKAALE